MNDEYWFHEILLKVHKKHYNEYTRQGYNIKTKTKNFVIWNKIK